MKAVKLYSEGMYLVNGIPSQTANISPEEARKNTIAYSILQAHNKKGTEKELKISFDALVSHDITYVGIIQTVRASGLEEFPIPYAMTNCHNSLCAVGGTINEDDHVFGLSAAKKYGGIYVPANQSVIHSYAREELAGCGKMILGSDSHTRYGALGTMGVGEGGPELVKQLLKNTYDINFPEVVMVYLKGTLCKAPNLRCTPMGRDICDLMLAVNRHYGRSDYLPCICWGLKAQEAALWGVGTSLRLEGRLQSRNYIKLTETGAEERVAFEVSVTEAEPALIQSARP